MSIKEGLYEDMGPEQYYGSDALGSSRLKAFAESPLHYEKFGEFKDTPALAFGRAAHVYILEGVDVFNESYAVMPDGMIRRGKEFTKFALKNQGKILLKIDEMDIILEMHEALMKSEAAVFFKKKGKTEVSLFWEHKGIQCKGRLDKLIKGESIDIMVDYKTCLDASEAGCRRSIERYKYWLQEAHYGSGYHQITGRDLEAVFIFQEKTSPYDVCMMRVSDHASPIAYERWQEYMLHLEQCINKKDFPGRNHGKGITEWEFWDIKGDGGFEEKE